MLNYILKPIRHQSFFKKYAGKKFLKVSPKLHHFTYRALSNSFSSRVYSCEIGQWNDGMRVKVSHCEMNFSSLDRAFVWPKKQATMSLLVASFTMSAVGGNVSGGQSIRGSEVSASTFSAVSRDLKPSSLRRADTKILTLRAPGFLK